MLIYVLSFFFQVQLAAGLALLFFFSNFYEISLDKLNTGKLQKCYQMIIIVAIQLLI